VAKTCRPGTIFLICLHIRISRVSASRLKEMYSIWTLKVCNCFPDWCSTPPFSRFMQHIPVTVTTVSLMGQVLVSQVSSHVVLPVTSKRYIRLYEEHWHDQLDNEKFLCFADRASKYNLRNWPTQSTNSCFIISFLLLYSGAPDRHLQSVMTPDAVQYNMTSWWWAQ